jgi:hypothetical protein
MLVVGPYDVPGELVHIGPTYAVAVVRPEELPQDPQQVADTSLPERPRTRPGPGQAFLQSTDDVDGGVPVQEAQFPIWEPLALRAGAHIGDQGRQFD